MATGGFSSKRLARVREVLERYVDSGFVAGAVAVVARHGEVHIEATGNLAFEGAGSGTPMAADTICRIASTTKPVVAACAMTLVEDCTLRPDDPVYEFLPPPSLKTKTPATVISSITALRVVALSRNSSSVRSGTHSSLKAIRYNAISSSSAHGQPGRLPLRLARYRAADDWVPGELGLTGLVTSMTGLSARWRTPWRARHLGHRAGRLDSG